MNRVRRYIQLAANKFCKKPRGKGTIFCFDYAASYSFPGGKPEFPGQAPDMNSACESTCPTAELEPKVWRGMKPAIWINLTGDYSDY
jgi:hypothetical protein